MGRGKLKFEQWTRIYWSWCCCTGWPILLHTSEVSACKLAYWWRLELVNIFWEGNYNKPFPSSLFSLFQNKSKCTAFHMEMSLISKTMKVQEKLISIWKVVHQDSFWKRGKWQLGNGLFCGKLNKEQSKSIPAFHVFCKVAIQLCLYVKPFLIYDKQGRYICK